MNTLTTITPKANSGRRRKGADLRGKRAVSTRCASVAGGASATNQIVKQPAVQERGFLMDLTGRTVRVKEGHLYAGHTGTVIECWMDWGVTVRLRDAHGIERQVQYRLKEVEPVSVEQTEDEYLHARFYKLGRAGRVAAESDRLYEEISKRRWVLHYKIRQIQRERLARLGIKSNTALIVWQPKGGRLS